MHNDNVFVIICNLLFDVSQFSHTHLEIRKGFVRENQTTAEKYTGGQISGIRKRCNQRNRSHLPIMREYSRTQEQPTIQRCQVAKSQQSEKKKQIRLNIYSYIYIYKM